MPFKLTTVNASGKAVWTCNHMLGSSPNLS